MFSLTRDANARTVDNPGRNPHVDRPGVTIVCHCQPSRRALVRVFERQLELVLDVAAGPLTGAACPRPAGAALEATATATAEEGREEVGERTGVPEHVLHLFLGHRPVATAWRTA